MNRYVGGDKGGAIRRIVTSLHRAFTIYVLPFALPLLLPPNPSQWVIKFVHNPFLQRNNAIVRDFDLFRTNLGTAFRNIAVADPVGFAQFLDPIFGVERMHLQRGRVNQKARPDKAIAHLVVAQNVADILAKKTFDALPKFLDAVDILLLHPPGPIGRVWRARLKRFDFFLYLKIPRHVGDQILHQRKCFHRLDGYRPVYRQIAHPGHAHELRTSIYLGRTGAAFPRLAIPPARQVIRLRSLNLINGVEDDHAFGDFAAVLLETTGTRVATPDFENCRFQS